MNMPKLKRLQARAADLRERRDAITRDQRDNETACQAEALKSALGETGAKRGFEQAAGRGVLLAAQASALDHAIADTEAEIGSVEVAANRARQIAEMEALRNLLRDRLQLAGEVEADLRALLSKFSAFSDLGSRIEQHSSKLEGHSRIMPALAPEATGGRLAEFMAGLGFGVWLPLTQPEARPAIAILKDVEEVLQRPYLARCQEMPSEEVRG